MKKIFSILMAAFVAVCLFSSCTKDNPDALKNYYSNSTAIENVNYNISVYQAKGDIYNWTVSNSTSEVSVKYTFSYDEKKAIRLDFQEIKAVVDNIIAEDVNIDRIFVQEFRYLNDEPKVADAYLSVNSGRVVVHFTIGNKEFGIPYEFVAGIVDALKPAE